MDKKKLHFGWKPSLHYAAHVATRQDLTQKISGTVKHISHYVTKTGRDIVLHSQYPQVTVEQME